MMEKKAIATTTNDKTFFIGKLIKFIPLTEQAYFADDACLSQKTRCRGVDLNLEDFMKPARLVLTFCLSYFGSKLKKDFCTAR